MNEPITLAELAERLLGKNSSGTYVMIDGRKFENKEEFEKYLKEKSIFNPAVRDQHKNN